MPVRVVKLGDEYAVPMRDNHKTYFQSAFQYVASFPPSIPATFINMYSDIGQTVLDPFSGKGTCPLQALVMGREAVGNDMSMVAYHYAHSRLKHVPLKRALQLVDEIEKETRGIKVNPYEFSPLLHLYTFDTLSDIMRLRIYFKDRFDDESIAIKAWICSILYGASPHDLTTDLPGTFAINAKSVAKMGIKPSEKDVFGCLRGKIEYAMQTGVPEKRGKMFFGNALDLAKKITDDSVNLVVSSPPYINLIMYGEKTWLAQWFLWQDYKEYDEKTKEVGSCSSNEDKYFGLMRSVLKILYDKLKNDSACVFVVGGSKADDRGVLYIPMKFVEIGKTVGFDVRAVYTREFHSSFRAASFDKETRNDKGTIYQDASIVFVKGNPIERMPFGEAVRFGMRAETNMDELENVDIDAIING